METQKKQILEYLKEGNKLTPILALKRFGCFRLSARIYELRREGHPIKSDLVKIGKKYVGSYFYNRYGTFTTLA